MSLYRNTRMLVVLLIDSRDHHAGHGDMEGVADTRGYAIIQLFQVAAPMISHVCPTAERLSDYLPLSVVSLPKAFLRHVLP